MPLISKDGTPSLQDDYPPDALGIEAMRVPASCHTCARRHVGTLGCEAFEVIPLEIMRGKHDHKSDYSGDNGLHYVPIGPGEPGQ